VQFRSRLYTEVMVRFILQMLYHCGDPGTHKRLGHGTGLDVVGNREVLLFLPGFKPTASHFTD
jgi:hypothetical protein